jgi:RNA polymerase sigma-70 factor (ECF subfamily)
VDLYLRYGPALRRKCERMLHSREDAEDVVQGVFVELLGRERPDVDLPYLYRAATSRALNVARDRRRRRSLLDRHGEVLAPPVGRPEDRAASRQILLQLIDTLDDSHAEILVYRYFDNLTQDEIAAITSVSRKTVGKRLDRIRDALEALSGGEEAQ